MNKIIEMNSDAMYMVVEAGVRTIDIQKWLMKQAIYMQVTRAVLKAA